jgi:hypothetical protein
MKMVRHHTETEENDLFLLPSELHFIRYYLCYFNILKKWPLISCADGYKIDMTAAGVIEIAKMHPFSAAAFHDKLSMISPH